MLNLPTKAFQGRFPAGKLGKEEDRKKESGGFGKNRA